jgi:hypothetical protein
VVARLESGAADITKRRFDHRLGTTVGLAGGHRQAAVAEILLLARSLSAVLPPKFHRALRCAQHERHARSKVSLRLPRAIRDNLVHHAAMHGSSRTLAMPVQSR